MGWKGNGRCYEEIMKGCLIDAYKQPKNYIRMPKNYKKMP